MPTRRSPVLFCVPTAPTSARPAIVMWPSCRKCGRTCPSSSPSSPEAAGTTEPTGMTPATSTTRRRSCGRKLSRTAV
eukprot:11028257-Heterocapsa_arctica.AAC.1